MAVDVELFRQIFGSLPATVAVVTAAGQGAHRGLACTAVSAVSLRPPMLMVCLDRTSDTLEAIRWSGGFVVNFLKAGRGELCERFAGKRPDKISGVPHVVSHSARGAPVLVEDSTASAECVLHQAVEAGDHWILVGLIEQASMYGGTPLTYFRRRYDSWPAAPVAISPAT
jgi:flavin reductase (DIM6/NTAB) family NADH-FMN oxidoreductase RutF